MKLLMDGADLPLQITSAAELGLGALVGSEGGPEKVGEVLQLYQQALKDATPTGVSPKGRGANPPGFHAQRV